MYIYVFVVSQNGNNNHLHANRVFPKPSLPLLFFCLYKSQRQCETASSSLAIKAEYHFMGCPFKWTVFLQLLDLLFHVFHYSLYFAYFKVLVILTALQGILFITVCSLLSVLFPLKSTVVPID